MSETERLTRKAIKKYEKARRKAQALFDAIEGPAWAEYQAFIAKYERKASRGA